MKSNKISHSDKYPHKISRKSVTYDFIITVSIFNVCVIVPLASLI